MHPIFIKTEQNQNWQTNPDNESSASLTICQSSHDFLWQGLFLQGSCTFVQQCQFFKVKLQTYDELIHVSSPCKVCRQSRQHNSDSNSSHHIPFRGTHFMTECQQIISLKQRLTVCYSYRTMDLCIYYLMST